MQFIAVVMDLVNLLIKQQVSNNAFTVVIMMLSCHIKHAIVTYDVAVALKLTVYKLFKPLSLTI